MRPTRMSTRSKSAKVIVLLTSRDDTSTTESKLDYGRAHRLRSHAPYTSHSADHPRVTGSRPGAGWRKLHEEIGVSGWRLALAPRSWRARLSRARLGHLVRGPVVVMTGGSRGLGLVMARMLVDEGARVVLLARDIAELERAREDLEARGRGEVMTLRCDVRRRADVRAAVDTCSIVATRRRPHQQRRASSRSGRSSTWSTRTSRTRWRRTSGARCT